MNKIIADIDLKHDYSARNVFSSSLGWKSDMSLIFLFKNDLTRSLVSNS